MKQLHPVEHKKVFSIRTKLILIITIQMLCLLSIFTFVLYSENREQLQYYEARNLHAAVTLHNTIVNQIQTIQSVTTFPVLQENSYSTGLFTLLSQGGNTMGNYHFQNHFREISHQFFSLHPFLDTMIIYNTQGEGNYTERSKAYDAVCLLNPTSAPWYQQVLDARGGAVIVPASAATGLGISVKEQQLLCVARSIINAERMRSIGVIVAGVSASQIDIVFDGVREVEGQRYGIYHQNRLVAGDLESDATAARLAATEIEEHRYTAYQAFDSASYMYSIYKSSKGYTTIIRTSMDKVHGSRKPSLLLYAVLALILVASFFITHSIVGGILMPIQSLILACNKLERHDFSARVNGQVPAEIAQLYRAFNHMTQRVHTLIHEVLLHDLAQNKLELQMLRTQISPHYLYNTLESMRMTAYVQGDLQVSEMAELLGNNLKYILRGTKDEVPVLEERQSVIEYARLVSLHYHGQIHIHVDIAEDVLACYTIKLILQPLVENAILHGLANGLSPLSIDIHGYLCDSSLLFVVSDDGKGIAPEKLSDIQKSLASGDDDTQSIGIKNIHRRLQLSYGAAFGLEIRSIVGMGTTVRVCLPIRHAPMPKADQRK